MPRSERCRIRGNCLDGNALPSRAQPPAGAERLTAAERPSLLEHPRRLIGPERAEEGARDCGRVWASGREPSARPRGSWRGPMSLDLPSREIAGNFFNFGSPWGRREIGPTETGFAGLRPPPSSPDKQRWFPDLRKSTQFQWLGGIKRSLRSRFLSFKPAERLERPSVSSGKNAVSQIDGCLFRKAAGYVKRPSDIAILVRGGRNCCTVNQI
jgi:hypothetical protein